MDGIAEHWRGLVDDAAIFPPGNLDLPEAVAAHRRHRAAPYAAMVGPFLVSDAKLPDLIALLHEAPPEEPLGISVVVTGGAGALEPAVRWAGRSEHLALRGIEMALRDEADLAHNARRVVTAVDQLRVDGALPEDAVLCVETPRWHAPEPAYSWTSALDELAAYDVRLKFRTGGADADAFPSRAELGGCITAALDRELPFKCTAGLHHATRHTDPTTGFAHHGFLNVLLATRASLDGDDVVAALADEDPATAVRDRDALTWTSTRRWFTGFGSCSVDDPLDDLVSLDLLGVTAR